MAGYIGSKASVVSSGAEHKKVFDITTTTTSLTGLVYTPTLVHVFHNGVRLVDGTDYTATSGTTITLTVAAENDDQVVVISYATFQTSDTVSASAGGTFAGDVTMTGKLNVDEISDADNTGPVTVTDGLNVSSGNVGIGTSSPERLLHVKGSVAYARIESTSVSQNAMLDIKSTVATWSIGQNAVKTDGSLEFYNGSSTPIFFTTSGAVTVGADLTLTNGNLVVAAGHGIDFSATAGTGTSELLDDYEEGTWTPTITLNTGTATTYSILAGTYTKTGRMVVVLGHILPTNGTFGSTNGYVRMTGLPFTQVGAIQGVGSGLNSSNLNNGVAGTCAYSTTLDVAFTSASSNSNSFRFVVTYFV
jgi:hypothetical protein